MTIEMVSPDDAVKEAVTRVDRTIINNVLLAQLA